MSWDIVAAADAARTRVPLHLSFRQQVLQMFSHVFVGVFDFRRALAFYRVILPILGLEERFCDPGRPWAGWQIAPGQRPLFLIGTPYDGRAHDPGNGQMTAFLAESRAAVDEVYTAALQGGGVSEGEPGLRPEYHSNYYGAYFKDTEGNKICVACHSSPELSASHICD
jgi:catechol 2,3-dioxygenase-like lactoylglutathione lyase family enzyme